MSRGIIFLLLLLVAPALWGQQPSDSLQTTPPQQVDSTLQQEELSRKEARRNARKAQDSLKRDLREKGISIEDVQQRQEVNPLAPSRAAFYSAVLPGLGQAYNKRYWKVPIVWGAIGTGVAVYLYNDGLYDRFRTAFKRRQAGFTDDEFFDVNPDDDIIPTDPLFSLEALEDGQERYQRDRDLAMLITIALYALNIIDANVDAHLKQYNVDENLSLNIQPYLELTPIEQVPNYGLAMRISF
ncbi:hypothetical protein SAMN04490243_0215 [Robiginitalea myxolifaciens]|uniref:DUF5683 domain-containing protein n=1 Tax=Robiginitalea myxolifaciens TaxID=400055 RepID=A0A1I6FNH7_9FLAO|nr:DUF5683 domain-containing protein [Robiginitalea myxolifaciens]SFR31414.1 hypothetical protein SAMN04490243_0215 [Robiginitalea myxolifaciens]